MPIIVCFKCARKDGRKPAAWWMDRGCIKGTQQRRWPVKFQRGMIGMVTQMEEVAKFSQKLLIFCANQTFIYSSQSLHRMEIELPSPSNGPRHHLKNGLQLKTKDIGQERARFSDKHRQDLRCRFKSPLIRVSMDLVSSSSWYREGTPLQINISLVNINCPYKRVTSTRFSEFLQGLLFYRK